MQRAVSSFDITPRLRGRRAVERRDRYLRLHPLCKACQRIGAVTLAVEVDHTVPLAFGGADTWDNLQGLCSICHGLKTAADFGHRPKGADLAGLPTDPRHPWNQAER